MILHNKVLLLSADESMKRSITSCLSQEEFTVVHSSHSMGALELIRNEDPSMQATAQAHFLTQASQVNTMLLNVLITKMEAITTN